MNNKVMAIVAHPDDEVFGCGGALLKHAENGDEIIVITLTDGCSSRDDIKKEDQIERQSAINSACDQLSAKLIQFDFEDNKMDIYPLLDVVKAIEKPIEEFSPHRIYTHHHGDLNIDHRICHQAVMTACRPQPSSKVAEILSFEVSSATEWNTPNINNAFLPNFYIDISAHIDKKSKLLDFYQKELRDFPHSRSKSALLNKSKYRGSEIGVSEAEAFQLIRYIE